MNQTCVLVIFISLSFLFVNPQIGFTKTCKKYGPQGQIIHYECPEPEKYYLPSWKVETTKKGSKILRQKIVLASVCFNYPEGSIDYRECRKEAKRHFDEKCNYLKEKYRKTKNPYNKEFKIEMDCFCEAEVRFIP